MKKSLILILLTILILSSSTSAQTNTKQASLEFNEAITLYNQGDYYNSEKKLLEEVKNNPNNKLAYLHLGAIYLKRKDYQNAAKYYDAANAGVHSKYYIGPYYLSGFCYYQMKNYDKAISRLTKYLMYRNQTKDKDTLADGYNLLGECYLKKNYCYSAASNFKKALKINKKHFLANKNLGLIYYKDGNNEKAKYYLNMALKEKRDAVALKILGHIYTRMKDVEQARSCFAESIAIDSDDYGTQIGFILSNFYYNQRALRKGTEIDIKPKEKAPESLHKLIKADAFVSNEKLSKLQNIIDLIWNDKEGEILLTVVDDNRITIVLESGNTDSNLTFPDYNITYVDGDQTRYVPVSELEEGNKFKIKINEKKFTENYETTLYDSISSVVSPICHAVYRQSHYTKEISKEEDLLCNLIGSNIAKRIIHNENLSKSETINEALMSNVTDLHNKSNKKNKDSFFLKSMRELNVNPPNYELYSDYYSTEDTKTTLHDYLYSATETFRQNQTKNTYKEHLSTKLIFCLDKNGNISNINIIKSSGNKKYDIECAEALEKSSPLPRPVPIKGDFAFQPIVYIDGNDVNAGTTIKEEPAKKTKTKNK